MNKFKIYLPVALAIAAAGCTAQEKKVVKELEDLPGITCTTNDADKTDCHADSLSATDNEQEIHY